MGNSDKQKSQQKQVVSLSRQAAGSNWQNALLQKEKKTCEDNKSDNLSKTKNEKFGDNKINNEKSMDIESKNAINSNDDRTNNNQNKKKRKARTRNGVKYVAMDCEMVGVGPFGTDDMLARVSIVNRNGDVLLDKYVKPREKVTDYRTKISGIRPVDIENGEDFDIVQNEVVELLQGKILVGHAIKHDLKVLYIKHPYPLIRDTSSYRPLSKLVSNGATPSLKRVAKVVLGIDIQEGEHNSVEDARATMQIYNCLRDDWEKYVQKKTSKSNHLGGLTAREYRRY